MNETASRNKYAVVSAHASLYNLDYLEMYVNVDIWCISPVRLTSCYGRVVAKWRETKATDSQLPAVSDAPVSLVFTFRSDIQVRINIDQLLTTTRYLAADRTP